MCRCVCLCKEKFVVRSCLCKCFDLFYIYAQQSHKYKMYSGIEYTILQIILEMLGYSGCFAVNNPVLKLNAAGRKANFLWFLKLYKSIWVFTKKSNFKSIWFVQWDERTLYQAGKFYHMKAEYKRKKFCNNKTILFCFLGM